MIITCYDCPDPEFPDSARSWRYPCDECAQGFVDSHKADTGHQMHTRSESTMDRYVYGRF